MSPSSAKVRSLEETASSEAKHRREVEAAALAAADAAERASVDVEKRSRKFAKALREEVERYVLVGGELDICRTTGERGSFKISRTS